MASYPGNSTSGATAVSSVVNGVGFTVEVTANPAAYRGLMILVSESYDGTNYGGYKPIVLAPSNEAQEALQGTNNTFAYLTKATHVNYEVQNLDQQALTATVSAVAF